MEILEFSWLPALAGGIMIGTASALLMLSLIHISEHTRRTPI